jgi:hypothetical protein
VYKKSLVITGLATMFALYFFPKQDGFWAYVSMTYLLSFINLIIALYLSTKNLRRLISYLLELPILPKRIIIFILFYTVIPIILCLIHPYHTGIIFFVFSLHQYRVWKGKRGTFLVIKDFPSEEK